VSRRRARAARFDRVCREVVEHVRLDPGCSTSDVCRALRSYESGWGYVSDRVRDLIDLGVLVNRGRPGRGHPRALRIADYDASETRRYTMGAVLEGPGEPRSSVRIARAPDGGRSWSVLVVAESNDPEAVRAALDLAVDLDANLADTYDRRDDRNAG
jgi:hypothetical protein